MNIPNKGRFAVRYGGFWSKFFDTPLTDLFRGRITGRCNVRRIIAAGNLPDPVAEGVWSCVKSSRRRRSGRWRLAHDLTEWAQQQLAAGRTTDEVVAELDDRKVLGAMVDLGLSKGSLAMRRLPVELRDLVVSVARQTRGTVSRREIALALYERLTLELDAGVASERLIDRFGNAAILVPLLSSPQLRPIALDLSFPVALLEIVQHVVARSRLWASEQRDVARELCAHFTDGLTAGRTASELAISFGPPHLAAQLIRRAKIRNRPLAWHLWRRSVQAALGVSLLLVFAWVWLVNRFHSACPGTVHDYVGDSDSANRAIPLNERAWPLYRQGIENLDLRAFGQRQEWTEIMNGLYGGPKDKHWLAALHFLHRHEDSLELFLKATERPAFAFVYRDTSNEGWLRSQGVERGVESLYPRDNFAIDILLPHIQDMRIPALFIGAATQESLAAGDAERAVQLLRARLRLADQLWRASEFAITDLHSTSQVRMVAATVAQTLSEQPRLFTDRALKALAHELAAACDGSPRVRYELDRPLFADWISHLYSDDGLGNGRLTAAGIAALRRRESMGRALEGRPLFWSWLETDLGGGPVSPLTFELAGSGLAAIVADRREMRAKCDELAKLYFSERERPYWQRTDSAYAAELERLRATPSLRQRFWPLILMLQTWDSASLIWDGDPGVRAAASLNTALIAIALELFHRREGRWPASLEQLVPGMLPRVPIDQFDGKPVRYRLIEGVPTVYSVGPDRRDDGGTPPGKGTPGWRATDGDWQLFPPTENPEE